MSQHHGEVAAWLAMLAARISPAMSQEQVEIMARDMAQGLADLPYDAFTPQSREAASRQWDRFPSYKSLRAFLEKWAEKHSRAASNLLPPVEDPNLSEDDKTAVRSWINRRSEGSLHRRLSLYRAKFPGAYKYILRTDAEAEAIARRKGWLGEEEPLDVSEMGITRNLIGIEKLAQDGSSLGMALARMGLALLTREVYVRAPARLHLLPAEIPQPKRAKPLTADQQKAALAAMAPKPAATGKPFGSLHPDHLSALRKQHGIPDIQPPPPAGLWEDAANA